MNLNLQKGFGLLGILIAVAVIAALAGGGLYWKETRNQKSLLQSGNDAIKKAEELKAKIERQNQQAVSGPSSVDTSNWKTYRNVKYGFEVKYPRNGIYSQIADLNEVDIHNLDDTSKDYIGEGGWEYHFQIFVEPNKNKIDAKRYVESLLQTQEIKFEKRLNILIGNTDAYELYNVFNEHVITNQFFLTSDDYIYSIIVPFGDVTADQILSTFKFIK